MADDESPLPTPSPPTSPDESPLASPATAGPRLPAHRGASDMSIPSSMSNMTASSTPRGTLDAARRPPGGPPPPRGATQMNPDIAARMKAFSLSRAGPPTSQQGRSVNGIQSPGPSVAGFPANFQLPSGVGRPAAHGAISAPVIPGAKAPGKGLSLAEKRGLKLPGGLPGPASTASPAQSAGRAKPKMTLSSMAGAGPANGASTEGQEPRKDGSQFGKYSDIIDTKTGALNFKGKATVHGQGIDFTSGKSFSISLDEVDTLDELGKGNYGTVFKVRHARPRFRVQGGGLGNNKPRGPVPDKEEEVPPSPTRPVDPARGGPTGIVMAMKEMRLELDDAKFQSIIMELDILHRCTSPYIVDFYGAFFQEGAVYICMEFMDGGSLDKLYGDGIPENVLRKITLSTTLGLKSLKEEHNIIHRDVKPTNILVNTRGQVKICDFGVSGKLVASIAKTNIGCQSYMAPERISGGGMVQAGASAGTYSVQSDIWSLGLTIIECALGQYPYPPETYENIWSQISAIVHGDPPDLPADKFSEAARDFVAGCLNKIPNLRPTYPMLLQHAWLAPLIKPETIAEEDEEAAEASGNAEASAPQPQSAENSSTDFVDREVGEWVLDAIDRRKKGIMGKSAKPALHAAPLDAVGTPSPLQAEKPKEGAVAA